MQLIAVNMNVAVGDGKFHFVNPKHPALRNIIEDPAIILSGTGSNITLTINLDEATASELEEVEAMLGRIALGIDPGEPAAWLNVSQQVVLRVGAIEILVSSKHRDFNGLMPYIQSIEANTIYVRLPNYPTATELLSELLQPVENPNLDKRVDELELSVRAANCLQNAGIETVRQIVEKGRVGLLATWGIHNKSVNEIAEVLAGLGIHLEPGNEPPSPIEGLSAEEVSSLIIRVDDIELSARTANCLRAKACKYFFQAIECIRPEGKKLPKGSPGAWPKNFGNKSFNELDEIARELGLYPGMRFTNEQRAKLLRLAQEKATAERPPV